MGSKLLKTLALLLPFLMLSGCIGGKQDGGFDVVAFLKNPIVMVIIGIIVLWFAFRSNKH